MTLKNFLFSGTCYRLYTKEEQDKFVDFSKPEITRTNLDSILLQLCALNVKNFSKFDFIDKPSVESIKKSAAILESLGAIHKLGKLDDSEYGVRIYLNFLALKLFSKLIFAFSISN